LESLRAVPEAETATKSEDGRRPVPRTPQTGLEVDR